METISASPVLADSSFQMIDVGAKAATARTAYARGTIHLSESAFQAIVDGTNPKGNVLALAEITAIQGAKNTSALLPLCHPLPLEKIRIRFEKNLSARTITIFSEVSTTAKTGVEMEALAAVNAGLLGIYDLSKAVDPVIEISGIRLDRKIGGKSGDWKHPEFQKEGGNLALEIRSALSLKSLQGVTATIVTLSDRCFKGESKDLSGPAIVSFVSERGAKVAPVQIIPDDLERIRNLVSSIVGAGATDFLILTGGTGVSPRDVTPEALAPLWTKLMPGIGELLRGSGAKHTPMSYLSRSQGGMIGECLVLCLPGSEKAVKEGLQALEPMLPHLFHVKAGGKH